MFSVLHSRTKFERSLFYCILLIAVVLGATSILSLIVAQEKFKVLLDDLWSRSAGAELQADLAFFANQRLGDLAAKGAALLLESASDCPASPLDLYVDRIAQHLHETPPSGGDLTPQRVQLYVRSETGWQLVSDQAVLLPGASSEIAGSENIDFSLRSADLDEFASKGTQPKQRRVGYIQSLVYRDGSGEPFGNGVILVLTSATSKEFTERWQRSIANVERPSFSPLFSQLIWLQIGGLLVALVVISVVAVIVSRMLSARLSQPLAELVSSMERVGSGDLSFRVKPSSQQEFGYLVDSFNTMVDNIQRLNEETRQTARMKRELEMGREIQLRMLPEVLPQPHGYDLCGTNVPSLELSGDYYDVISIGENGNLVLAVADVSGKGLPAAMLMSNIQACLHSQALRPQVELTECVGIINRLLRNSTDAGTFATFFVAMLSPQQRRLVYVNAGHPPALLLRRTGEILDLAKGGPIVGVIPDVTYDSGDVELSSGDILCLYTDGITEALGANGEEFGCARLARLLVEMKDLSAQGILARVVETVKEYSGLQRQSDDITVLVLKVL
jgi:serine phosphatase RsbU (regulator of sigma subunit)